MDFIEGSVKFGVLLPITSRGLPDPSDCIRNLGNFATSLKETTNGNICHCDLSLCTHRYELKVYVGVDASDVFLLVGKSSVEQVLIEHGIVNVETMTFEYPPGSICAIWRDLARRAHEDQCHYTVLMGDDIVVKSPGWMSSFHKAFCLLESNRGVPRGFGCVAFADGFFPGFPTFPVLGRPHFEIFAGEVLPNQFINQDGDPYLFQLYRRWGCSMMLQDVLLENTMGGSREPRYEKKHCGDWTFDVLDAGVAKVRKWLSEKLDPSHDRHQLELLTLDVVVPTFRVPLAGIDVIINLKRSETCSTTIIIIVDNPLATTVRELKKKYEHDAFIRIRVNNTNCGASESRNRGLAESAADYVLFLDDDVIPDPDILLESEKVIREYPKACGFVGDSRFPDPTTSVVSSAIVFSGITYFWGITKLLTEDIPWGVTANLLVRRNRDNVLFDLRFPKTGGGEDIDFCLRKRDAHVKSTGGGEGFRGAPKVIVIHPWWNQGRRSFNHFLAWGIGDGALVKMYPHFTYRDVAPNSAETLFLMVILCTITAAAAAATGFIGARCLSIRYLLSIFLVSVPEIFIANALYDIHRYFWVDEDQCLPELCGYRRLLAAAESSIVRMASEWGRLVGMIRRNEWSCIGCRFDWFAGRFGDVPLKTERKHTLGRFLVWLALLTITAATLISTDIYKMGLLTAMK